MLPCLNPTAVALHKRWISSFPLPIISKLAQIIGPPQCCYFSARAGGMRLYLRWSLPISARAIFGNCGHGANQISPLIPVGNIPTRNQRKMLGVRHIPLSNLKNLPWLYDGPCSAFSGDTSPAKIPSWPLIKRWPAPSLVVILVIRKGIFRGYKPSTRAVPSLPRWALTLRSQTASPVGTTAGRRPVWHFGAAKAKMAAHP